MTRLRIDRCLESPLRWVAASSCVVWVALGAGLLWSLPARALGPDWTLPAGSREAIDTKKMWIFGRQASLRTFEVPANIADVAVGLIDQVDAPPLLQAMPDGLLIAGKDGEVQWLVRLVASADARTQGSASAIDLQQLPALPALRWQPDDMTVRMDVATRDDTGLVRQQVLTVNQPAEALHRRLCSALPRHGWRIDDTMAGAPCNVRPLTWPASSFWQREGATLALVTDRQASGSSLFVLQTGAAEASLRGLPERLGNWLGNVRLGEVR